MKLFIVRHGQTQANVDRIIQGWQNSPLTETGHSQAKEAASKFNEPVTTIYCSDLTRTLETAEYFKDRNPDAYFIKDVRLRERNFGDAEGDSSDDHDWERFMSLTDTAPFPNGETLNDFTKRVKNFLESLAANHDDDEIVLIVTHGLTISRFLELTGTAEVRIPVDNCEITEVNT